MNSQEIGMRHDDIVAAFPWMVISSVCFEVDELNNG